MFTAVMAAVLVSGGYIIHERFEDQLDVTIEQGLRTRAADITALVQNAERGRGAHAPDGLTESGESAAQVLTPSGRILETTPQLGNRPLLDANEAARASTETAFLEHPRVRGLEGSARLLATPVTSHGARFVVVVASSLDEREEALESLSTILLIGGPIGLLISSLASYGAVTAALRPVEAMRRRAAEISTAEPDHRLPISPAPDELRRLAETLNGMLGRIQETLAHERAFVDDASHELRTPLALHRTELELALRYSDDADELRAAITSAIVEVDRLTALTEDLLVLARSDQRSLGLDLEEIDAGALLAAIAARFQSRADGAGRELRVDAPTILGLVGDRRRLEQAIGNLLDNALVHGSGDVVLAAKPSAGHVRLSVSDSGEALDASFAPHAFERFSRADAARTTTGTGLGLPIVGAVAEAHGGSAGLDKLAGGGSSAWIEIPPEGPE